MTTQITRIIGLTLLSIGAFGCSPLPGRLDGGTDGSIGTGGGSMSIGGGAGTGGGGGTGGGAAESIEQACTDFSTAVCANLQRCAPFSMSWTYADQPNCVARLKLLCPGMLQNGSGVTSTKLKACAAGSAALSCAEFLSGVSPAACDIRGTLPSGASCAVDEQCSSGFCKMRSACGVCSERVALGGACTELVDCVSGLYCFGSSSKTCQAMGGPGESCSATAPCRPDLYCHSGACAEPAKTVGSPCTSAEAGSCDSNLGLQCDAANSTCVALGLADAGSPCGLVGGTSVFCKASATCKYTGSSGTCIAPAADGAPCSVSASIGCAVPSLCINGVCTLRSRLSCP